MVISGKNHGSFDASEAKSTSGTKRLLIVLAIVVLITLATVAAAWFLVVENIADEVTVEAGSGAVDANDYRLRDWNIPASFATDLSSVDLNVPGVYPVKISYCGRVFDAAIRVVDTVSPEASVQDLSTLSTVLPDPGEFFTEVRDVTQVTASYETEPDLTLEGDQTVTLLLTDEGGNTSQWQATLTVIHDKQPPVIEGARDQVIYRGQEPDYLSGVTITDDLDDAPVLTADDSGVDLTRGGEYRLTYRGVDASGNETTQTVTVTVIADETAPSILGVQPISLYAGSTVSYRSGILVTDDHDENPTLSIDSTQVDLSQPGTYEVTYRAKDAAGNESSVTTTVTVEEKPESYVEEETIYAEVDELLAQITTEEMTDREKVEAVFKWITGHYSYYGDSDKTDWLQAAHALMTRRMGDCFNFYALSKLMLDRLGIPNITVTRSEDSLRRSNHYWSLVSVDGGETYYHFDTTPHSSGPSYRFCLVTDEYLDFYSTKVVLGYYTRDTSLYPATPTEPLE